MKKIVVYKTVLSTILLLNLCFSVIKDGTFAVSQTESNSWKWDVDIYDWLGWSSSHWYSGTIQKKEGDEIFISFDTADESGINDEFFIKRYRKVVLFITKEQGG